jgi:hypothetical protein
MINKEVNEFKMKIDNIKEENSGYGKPQKKRIEQKCKTK